MPFEDLLAPRDYGCKTCWIIEGLEPATLREEVDIAMKKIKFGDKKLATALGTVSGTSISPSAVHSHRQHGHR